MQIYSWRPVTGVAVAALAVVAGAARQPGLQVGAPQIQAVVTARGGSAAEAAVVTTFYRRRGGATAWHGRSGAAADRAAVTSRLAAAATHGLDPGHYLGPVAVGPTPVAVEAEVVADDIAVTLGAVRLMRDLRHGHVDPLAVGVASWNRGASPDMARLLADAVGAGTVGAAIDGMAPAHEVYGRLRRALQHYDAISGTALPRLPRLTTSRRPGDTWPGMPAVVARLIAFGDLAAEPPLPPDSRYDARLEPAVRRFQQRHGLSVDGILGARTLEALAVTPARRATQIRLALERLRWLQDRPAGRVVVVNIPMFQLWTWDAGAFAGPPAASMRVIVGRREVSETPVFTATLDHMIFRPYWNVPPSILRDEILPAWARDADYLTRQQMEIVDGPGDDAQVMAADPVLVPALRAGRLRVRQRPGAHNALGLVKFMFPNSASVYLHGTPTPSLFARERRDLSHGCVRVADPPGLASWVLGRVGGWSEVRIASAMHGDHSERVDLTPPIDVALVYLTAIVAPDGAEAVHFADDLYGLDARLARALIRQP